MDVVVIVAVLAVGVVGFILSARRNDVTPVRPPPESEPRDETATPAARSTERADAPETVRSPKMSPSPNRTRRSARTTAQLGRTPFAIVDVETTGFHAVPQGGDRVVEIAVVRMSPDGRIEDEYVTLVNPQRRMGATRIHGITSSDVKGAPSFADIAGEVADRIGDAIVVAHNVPFDLRFLRGEYEHAGHAMPEVPRLCTLDLAYRLADVKCRKLGFLCEEYGITVDEHTALGDARAVSQLLTRFLAEGRKTGANIVVPEIPVAGTEWCNTRRSGVSFRRDGRSETAPTNTVLAKRSVQRSVKVSEQQYLDALELAVADGELTNEEFAALAELARQLDVSSRELNRSFVESLADGAKADGTVTPAEAEQVHRTARLLGVSDSDAAAMLVLDSSTSCTASRIGEGTPVCFLGSFDVGAMAEMFAVASKANLVVRKNITASLGLVVAESGSKNVARVNRAKALGIPVVTATEFMQLVARSRPQA